MSIKYHLYVFLLAALTLVACNVPDDVSQAQQTVALADSLRVRQASASADNLSAPDSAALALAYHTLAKNAFRRWHYADDYTRACYHYGRQLRQSGNQVAAMQCFIDGTHSRSRNYKTRAYIYSDMGDMCHLAGDFDLSYELFKKSSECFLLSGDTMPYFLSLYSMAYEKAEQLDKCETLQILNTIENGCSNKDIMPYVNLTKAQLYLRLQQYDSAIYYAHKIYRNEVFNSSTSILLGQAYSFLSERDSALYYANIVLNDSFASYNDRFNALYIVSHDNPDISNDELRDATSEREDIRYYQMEPENKQFLIAVNMLLDDTNNKGYYLNYSVLCAVIVILVIVFIIVRHKIIKHKKEISKERKKLCEETRQECIKQTELRQQQQQIIIKNEELLSETTKLEQRYSESQQRAITNIENNCTAIRESHDWKKELHWNDFSQMCGIINENFYFLANKLKSTGKLNEKEIRLCVLVLLNFSYEQMANVLAYSDKGVGKFKYITATKLGTTTRKLRSFLIEMASGGQFVKP